MLCIKCKEDKEFSDFRCDVARPSGYHPYCKSCEKLYKDAWYISNKERISLKQRNKRDSNPLKVLISERKNTKHEFTITEDDLTLPDLCPILKIPLFSGQGKTTINSPSLDRIDNSIGYVRGNVWIISHLANRMKSDATEEELNNFCRWIKGYRFESEINVNYDKSNNFRGCKDRAKKLNLPFNISIDDIQVPYICPALGVDLFRLGGNTFNQNVATVDRIIPELGYVKGNIQILSKKANTMKNCATIEQLHSFADWYFERKAHNENL